MSFSTIAVAGLFQFAALGLIMAGAWAIQQRSGNAGYIDVVWTFGLGIVGMASALAPLGPNPPSGRQILVAALIAAWSLRLGWHILRRSQSRGDDPRYAALIRAWGHDARRQMFLLVQKQALVTVPLAMTILVAAHNPAPLFRFQDVLAIIILAAGIVGEAVADRQLGEFSARKSGICDSGLWRWSRHPNYFFEWLFWFAMPLLAISGGGAYTPGWIAVAGPLCMYWLLVHVSGIPPLEEHMLEKHGDGYRAYQARTSAFLPLPPGGD